MREIITEWTTPAGGGNLSVMYFAGSGTAEAQRAALADLWNAVDANMPNTTSWRIRTEGRFLQASTGDLLSFWSDPTVYTGSGGGSGVTQWADASQALMRWRTEGVVRNRRVQGRTFVPGLATGNSSSGNLSAGTQSSFNTAINAFLAAAELVVWSRPTDTDEGQQVPVTSGAVWSEIAVLRRRRA